MRTRGKFSCTKCCFQKTIFLSLRNSSTTPPTSIGDVRSGRYVHLIELIFEIQMAFDKQSGSTQNIVRVLSLVFFGDFFETRLHTNGF